MKVSRERIERLRQKLSVILDGDWPHADQLLWDMRELCCDLLADLGAEGVAKVEKIKECQ